MARRISERKKKMIMDLSRLGMSASEIAAVLYISSGSVTWYRNAQNLGFSSFREYSDYITREKGYKSVREYREKWVDRRGFDSYRKYQNHLVTEKGYTSTIDYMKHLCALSQSDPVNQKLAGMIKARLEQMHQSQSWLARQIGVSRQAVLYYTKGRTCPSPYLWEKICSALSIDPKTLDDLVEEKEGVLNS